MKKKTDRRKLIVYIYIYEEANCTYISQAHKTKQKAQVGNGLRLFFK